MPRLRRVARLCSRTVSGTAYRFRHGSTLCSPTVEKILCRSPFRSGHMSAICARPSKGKGRKSEGGNRRCLPSCAPARRQRSSVRFSSDTPPLGKEVKIIGWKPQVSTLLPAAAGAADLPAKGWRLFAPLQWKVKPKKNRPLTQPVSISQNAGNVIPCSAPPGEPYSLR